MSVSRMQWSFSTAPQKNALCIVYCALGSSSTSAAESAAGAPTQAATVASLAFGCSVAILSAASPAGTHSWKCRSPAATRMSAKTMSCPPCATKASTGSHDVFCIEDAVFGSCVAARRLRSVAACPRSTAR